MLLGKQVVPVPARLHKLFELQRRALVLASSKFELVTNLIWRRAASVGVQKNRRVIHGWASGASDGARRQILPDLSVVSLSTKIKQGCPITLWLVDDDINCRQMFAEAFNRTHSVKCVSQFSCGEEVLNALRVYQAPDVILSDVHMPGLSGVEMVAPIKALAPTARIVLFTSLYDPALATAAYEAGAANLVSKTDAFRKVVQFAHTELFLPRELRPLE